MRMLSRHHAARGPLIPRLPQHKGRVGRAAWSMRFAVPHTHVTKCARAKIGILVGTCLFATPLKIDARPPDHHHSFHAVSGVFRTPSAPPPLCLLVDRPLQGACAANEERLKAIFADPMRREVRRPSRGPSHGAFKSYFFSHPFVCNFPPHCSISANHLSESVQSK